MPPITELTRIEPVHLERLEKQGIFTTGLLLEVSETQTRRQSLADHVDALPLHHGYQVLDIISFRGWVPPLRGKPYLSLPLLVVEVLPFP